MPMASGCPRKSPVASCGSWRPSRVGLGTGDQGPKLLFWGDFWSTCSEPSPTPGQGHERAPTPLTSLPLVPWVWAGVAGPGTE